MSALRLRRVGSRQALASRALGAGQRLAFNAQGHSGELLLLPAGPMPPVHGLWLSCAAGVLCLSEADSVLSVLGEAPWVSEGEPQPWYWSFFNQCLSPVLGALLAPLAPLEGPPPPVAFTCKVRAQLAGQTVHALLSAPPDTLLRLLEGAAWQPCWLPLDDTWPVLEPVVVGGLTLTPNELESLRPGDVVVPTLHPFGCDGRGALALGGRRWAVEASQDGPRLFVRLCHEEQQPDEY